MIVRDLHVYGDALEPIDRQSQLILLGEKLGLKLVKQM